MARKRRRFGSSFKAKIAIEAVKEYRTLSELAKKHKLHVTQIYLWKKQLIDGAEFVFEGDTRAVQTPSDEPQAAELYEQIGRLKVQLEWLKQNV